MAALHHGLLSPAASSTSYASASAQHSKSLPLSRKSPLKPGSHKEIALINHVDDKILRITRRYAKKFSNSDNDMDDTTGYVTLDEVVVDLDAVFNVVWISGTPTLQVPYLLSLAGLLCSYMAAFPFSSSMFRLVRKLDEAFACLLREETSTVQRSQIYHVTTTDRVRIRSLIQETRVVAVEVASESGQSLYLDASNSSDDEQIDEEDEISDQVSLSLSKIYKRTVDLLGDPLVSEPSSIP